MNIDPNDPAWRLLRRLARLRAERLLQHQDHSGGSVELLPTTLAELEVVREALGKIREAEWHAAISLVIDEIDAADSAKQRALSKALDRVLDQLRARETSTTVAVAT